MQSNKAQESQRQKVEEGDHGVVFIASGAHQGRVGYYDDDEGGAIVYLGAPCLSEYVTVRRSLLRTATADEIAAFEQHCQKGSLPDQPN